MEPPVKQTRSSSVLFVAGCLPFLVVLAVSLLHSVFAGVEYGIAAASRTAIILAPSLILGALYVQRSRGRGEANLLLATPTALLMQLVFLALGMPGFVDSRVPAYWAAARSDVRNLTSMQEIFLSEEGHYSADLDSLQFATSDGVEVELRSSGDGWSARVTHSLLGPEYACAVWQGTTEPFTASAGRVPPQPGRPLCYQSHRLSRWGRMGDGLFTVHQRMDGVFDLAGG